jgi:hypothetical protein
MLGLEPAIGSEAAFHESLSFIRKGIRQRVASRVAHWQGLAFAFQNKINPPRRVSNAADCHRSAHTYALRPLGAVQGLQFGNGVIIRLAFAIPEPGEEPERHQDNPDSDSEFGLLLHFGLPAKSYDEKRLAL